eukprot:9896334-Alexandrium_andersonii.AAC.1
MALALPADATTYMDGPGWSMSETPEGSPMSCSVLYVWTLRLSSSHMFCLETSMLRPARLLS